MNTTDDRETAWADINPTMGLARRPEPQSKPLAHRPLSLDPASEDDFRRELTACLALVAGIGMTQDGRREWLIAARGTLHGIPADLLERGCRAARLVADHPAKIVPAIMAEVESSWKWRREHCGTSPAEPPIPRERRIEKPVTPEEIEATNRALERLGATTRYRQDGTRYTVDTAEKKQADRGPLRRPTRQDYIALGVDPAVLDAIEGEKSEQSQTHTPLGGTA